MQQLDIGIIGLSVMGRSLALNMADHGFAVGGYNRSAAVTEEVLAAHPHKNLHGFFTLEELVAALARPRRVFLMIQAGKPVDAVLDSLLPLLAPGDVVMDGGNSYFEDTRRRSARLEALGLHYFGVGVSGGEEGARRGPSIMPGGDRAAYELVRPILEAIAARAEDGAPCCAYIGPDGAGHYVKMVHNGIEYADMQLIAEAYLLLRETAGFSNAELAELFREWNKGELKSYLIGITASIFAEADDLAPGDLIDRILDSAGQKGTGRWAGIESLRQGVDISMILAAGNARVLSNDLARRRRARSLIAAAPALPPADRAAFAEQVRRALYMGKIIAYAQGFALLADASRLYGWQLDLGGIAAIFRAGCIIQAAFLSDITAAFGRDPALPSLVFDRFFLERINLYAPGLRAVAAAGLLAGVPVPALANAVTWLDGFAADRCGANLIQAQRDCFGAHTYGRTDREGVFHHEWTVNQ